MIKQILSFYLLKIQQHTLKCIEHTQNKKKIKKIMLIVAENIISFVCLFFSKTPHLKHQ